MKILLFNLITDVNDPILGFACQWIQVLAEKVESIDIITMKKGSFSFSNNVQVYSVGKEKGFSEPKRALEFYRILILLLSQNKYDVCFAHMMPLFAVMAAPILKLKVIPIITWYAHRSVTTILKLAHFCSDYMVTSAKESYGYKHDKLLVIGQGIDINLFTPISHVNFSEIPMLLSVGRLSPIKDLMTLINAVNLLHQKGYKINCTLVGNAPERDQCYFEALQKKVSDLGLENQIIFAGAMPNQKVVYLYQKCFAHINCAPANHSLDKAVLEAMACGKPSISSILGIKETMGKWHDLLSFKQGNPQDLANKIEYLLNLQPKQREEIGLDLRQSVIQKHSLLKLRDNLIDIFKHKCYPDFNN